MERSDVAVTGFACGLPAGLGFLLCGSAVTALPYAVGPYIFEIEVRSKTMLPLPGAWVTCKLRGDEVKITVRSPGYVRQERCVPVGGGQNLYRFEFVLADQHRDIVVRDPAGTVLKSAYIDRSQYGFDPRDYGITLFVPVKMLKEPSTRNVQVFNDVFFSPIVKSMSSDRVEEFWRIRLSVDRVDWECVQHLASIVVKTDPRPSPWDDEEETDDDAEPVPPVASAPVPATAAASLAADSPATDGGASGTLPSAGSPTANGLGSLVSGFTCGHTSGTGPRIGETGPGAPGAGGTVVGPVTPAAWIACLGRLEQAQDANACSRSADLAGFLAEVLPAADLDAALAAGGDTFPRTLRRVLIARSAFRQVHGEKEER